MEWLVVKAGEIAIGQAITWSVGGIAVFIVTWLLKRIPNELIKAKWGKFMFCLGVVCTLGITKWGTSRVKWFKKVWDLVEKWILDFVENILIYGFAEWVRGMRSDNKMDDQTEFKVKRKARN